MIQNRVQEWDERLTSPLMAAEIGLSPAAGAVQLCTMWDAECGHTLSGVVLKPHRLFSGHSSLSMYEYVGRRSWQ